MILHNPFLIGERIYLRALEPARDYEKFALWHNAPEMHRYFNVYPTSETRARERLDQLYRDFKHSISGIAANDGHGMIGVVGLKDRNTHIAGWHADEKAGFKYEGTLREVISRVGSFHDVCVYSLLRREYLETVHEKM